VIESLRSTEISSTFHNGACGSDVEPSSMFRVTQHVGPNDLSCATQCWGGLETQQRKSIGPGCFSSSLVVAIGEARWPSLQKFLDTYAGAPRNAFTAQDPRTLQQFDKKASKRASQGTWNLTWTARERQAQKLQNAKPAIDCEKCNRWWEHMHKQLDSFSATNKMASSFLKKNSSPLTFGRTGHRRKTTKPC